MRRRFLPALRGRRDMATPVPQALQDVPEVKTVLADYYSALASTGLYSTYRARPWPIERAVAEGYERLVYVFKSVEAIAGNASRLPFRLKDGEHILDDHPLYRVLNGSRANPLETGQQFRKRLSAQILLSKKGAFVELTLSRGGDIVRMDLLPPGRTRPIPSADPATDALIDHYEVLRLDGTRSVIPPERVRWFRDPHPLDPFSGITPLEAAGLSTELDFFSRLYNVMFLKNDGRPGGIVAVNGELSPGGAEKLESRFGRGPTESGKVTVIEGEVSYVDIAAKPRDMAHKDTSTTAKTEILTAFGVPESVIGDASGRTWDNAEQELYNFWTITMPSHINLVITGLDGDSEDGLEGFLDTDTIEVLQRAKIARRAEARQEFAAGLITPDEYRDSAGYPVLDRPQTRSLWLPPGLQQVPTSDADATKIAQEKAAATPAGLQPAASQDGRGQDGAGQDSGSAAAGGRGGAETDATAAPPPQNPAGGGSGGGRREGKSAPLRQVHLPQRRHLRLLSRPGHAETKSETKSAGRAAGSGAAEGDGKTRVSEADTGTHDRLEEALTAALTTLHTRLLARASARLGSPKTRKGTRHWTQATTGDARAGTKAVDAGRAVDRGRWHDDAVAVAEPILSAAAVRAATGLVSDLSPGADPAAAAAAGRAAAAAAADRVGQSFAAAADRIAALIEAADGAGDPMQAMQAAVLRQQRQTDDGQPTWVDTTAATAATAAMSAARDGAAAALNADTGQDLITRQWRTRGDQAVRATHREASGQHRGLDEPFKVGDALLRYPGDEDGPPGEVIGCRCRLQYRHAPSGRYTAAPAEHKEASAESVAGLRYGGVAFAVQAAGTGSSGH